MAKIKNHGAKIRQTPFINCYPRYLLERSERGIWLPLVILLIVVDNLQGGSIQELGHILVFDSRSKLNWKNGRSPLRSASADLVHHHHQSNFKLEVVLPFLGSGWVNSVRGVCILRSSWEELHNEVGPRRLCSIIKKSFARILLQMIQPFLDDTELQVYLNFSRLSLPFQYHYNCSINFTISQWISQPLDQFLTAAQIDHGQWCKETVDILLKRLHALAGVPTLAQVNLS